MTTLNGNTPYPIEKAIHTGLAKFFPEFSTPECQKIAIAKGIGLETRIIVWKIDGVFVIMKHPEKIKKT